MKCATLEANLAGNGTRIDGWVSPPNIRGTLDILWDCLFTVFVSTFTILYLNIPSRHEKPWVHLRRKLFWMSVAIAGPEFVLTFASAQLGRATESVKAFHAAGYKDWTMRHGFFADMGGFLFMPRDSDPFPVTSKHVLWLVTKKHIPFPEVKTRELWDRSKQDTVVKVITCFQIAYLILQCIGRAIQHLSITTMELFALAIVVCSIMTSFCWLHKPVDVQTSIPLPCPLSTEEILAAAGRTNQVWRQTPLDFVDDLMPSWALNVQTFMRMPTGPHERPMPRFGNDRLPSLRGRPKSILCVTTLGYAAIHLAGWNFRFPTRAELILWRTSSMFLFCNTVAFWMFETTASWHRKGRWLRTYCRIFDRKRLDSVAQPPQRPYLAEADEPPKQLPLPWEFWSIFPLSITYAAARGYLVVEVFLGLRSLEPSAYATVNWSNFFPHVT